MENIGKVLDSGILSQASQSVEAMEELKMNGRCGNVIENKGSGLENQKPSGNVTENKGSYALKAGMLLKKQVVSYR
jgi:hypothetical protein